MPWHAIGSIGSVFPRCKSYISVEKGLGEVCLLVCLVFSRETDISSSDTSFRHNTVYKTSQERVSNSLYVKDIKEANGSFPII